MACTWLNKRDTERAERGECDGGFLNRRAPARAVPVLPFQRLLLSIAPTRDHWLEYYKESELLDAEASRIYRHRY